MTIIENSNLKKDKVKYLAISHDLRTTIMTGGYKVGSKIPGDFELAEKYRISRITARQALSVLEKEGLVTRKPGVGTFVNSFRTDGIPNKKLHNILFLLVDIQPRVDYYLWEMRAAEQWLATQGVAISMAHLNTEDYVKNGLPPILENDMAQGVLLDGFVTPLHCSIIENLKLPYLVVGNHDIKNETPQVRCDGQRIGEKATRFLYDLKPELPVANLIEPFQYYFTKELFAGYSQVVKSLPQGRPILQTCDNNDGYRAMQALYASGLKEFSIYTTHCILPGILKFYREHNISTRKYPILTVGSPEGIAPEHRQESYLIPIVAEKIMLNAVQTFVKNYLNPTGRVYIELDAGEIESPSTI